MTPFDLPTQVVDRKVFDSAARHLRKRGVVLPKFSELADPSTLPGDLAATTEGVAPDEARSANLLRVHWFNDRARRGRVEVPVYIELPKALTGTDASIVVMLGKLFPMVGAHKVLAAYACLIPRLISGQFEPSTDRAIWPSTGNYCRGGVAISRILGCHGVAVLPEGMSAERFDWLADWVTSPEDIIRTPGSESNVKEIYDKCAELGRDPRNAIINQFSEFANYLGHYVCTGRALEIVFEDIRRQRPGVRLAAFTAGTGSAGTLAAGDYLKEKHGTRIVAVEPVECPTLLYNGYGEHNIQGIGDKHVPLIHNVMNTDMVVGISDQASDDLDLVFNSAAGHSYLKSRRGVDPAIVDDLDSLGFSGIANILAAIKVAKRLDLGADDVIITVATDSAALYPSERKKRLAEHYDNRFDEVSAGEAFGRHVLGLETDHVIELGHRDRLRIFNLGYYTWVEQQGIELADFDRRKDQGFWRGLTELVPVWDRMIDDMNNAIGVNRPS